MYQNLYNNNVIIYKKNKKSSIENSLNEFT